jgi:predicted  nucleic acid-binding Zn-ribbon protein
LKRHELVKTSCDYDIPHHNKLSSSIDVKKSYHTNSIPSNTIKCGYNYDEVFKVMNERDVLKQRLYYDQGAKDAEKKEIEHSLYLTKEELHREQKINKEKISKLEFDLQNARTKLDETNREKEDLHCKMTSIENKVITLQQELNKKERENFNGAIAENTERHLTSLCQTLTSQLEDLKDQLRLSDERYLKIETESQAKSDKIDVLMNQLDSLQKENDTHVHAQNSLKKTYDEQLKNKTLKEKVF